MWALARVIPGAPVSRAAFGTREAVLPPVGLAWLLLCVGRFDRLKTSVSSPRGCPDNDDDRLTFRLPGDMRSRWHAFLLVSMPCQC